MAYIVCDPFVILVATSVVHEDGDDPIRRRYKAVMRATMMILSSEEAAEIFDESWDVGITATASDVDPDNTPSVVYRDIMQNHNGVLINRIQTS